MDVGGVWFSCRRRAPNRFGCVFDLGRRAYEAALPVAERSRCGNGTLAAMMVIFFGPPIFGCIGALVGAALSRLPRIFGD